MQIVLRHFAVSKGSILDAFDAWLNQCAMSASPSDERNSVPLAVEMAQINAARSGDEDAFRQLLKHYQPTISQQMRRFSRDRVVVENLVHDVFVEAFMSLDSFKGRSPFQHWLRKLAVRVGYRHWKTEARNKKRLKKLRDECEFAPKFSGPPVDAIDAREQLHLPVNNFFNKCSLVESRRKS